MKIQDILNLSNVEIDLEVERLREHAFSLRAQAVTEKLQNPTQLTNAKRDIARLMTIKRQRQLAEQAGKATQ
jgi:large subunit ribosomal protein L29